LFRDSNGNRTGRSETIPPWREQSSADECELVSIQGCPGQGVQSIRDDAEFPLSAQNKEMREILLRTDVPHFFLKIDKLVLQCYFSLLHLKIIVLLFK
jgi:hypothetical protein